MGRAERLEHHGITLDPFQVAAIEAIERHDTVIVTAPTGAGKTVIAEHAIETYLEQDRRILYTAPIKALSNQKFRDFGARWGDHIGIVTGDVSINPLAPVLLMTTEIFRNTIFDDPARLHDVEYVVLDEIHYINDIQRGTVWEESLIFAPQHIAFICLSATIPNLEEFAGWLREVRPGVDVTVIREDERPVPLDHHLWLPGIGEAKLSDLRRLGERAADRRLRRGEARRALGAGRRDPAGRGDLVAHLQLEERLPCLYFCFARQACEENAAQSCAYSLLDEAERDQMLSLFDLLRSQFGLDDDTGAERMRNLLAHGVAFHHAGMLPMLKEVVERTFASGLLKLLYTTETFAVGVNMPACTVVFESLEKYDGVDTRYLLTREYQQMAGRAGRRGLDERGYVYSRIDPTRFDLVEVERILSGDVEPTESQFNLSYSSILSLYEKHGEGIYDVCHRSFGNYQNVARVREMEAEVAALEGRGLAQVDCYKGVPKSIRKYLEARDELQRAHGRAETERRRIMTRFRAKRDRQRRERELLLIDEPVLRLEQKLADSPCHNCQNRKECSRVQHGLNEHHGRTAALRRAIEALKHHQRDQIAKRLTVLRERGYVDERGLTAKGEMAACLYGFEIAITELFYAGFFEDVDEVAIGCLMVAIVFESKRSGWYAPSGDAERRLYLREAAQLVREVGRREWELNIENATEPVDDNLTMASVAWLNGQALDELRDFTDASPGDIVRTFRHATDLLRQFRGTLKDYPLLRDKVDAVIRRLKRDEVDAERQLRMGHEVDRRQAPVEARTAGPGHAAAGG